MFCLTFYLIGFSSRFSLYQFFLVIICYLREIFFFKQSLKLDFFFHQTWFVLMLWHREFAFLYMAIFIGFCIGLLWLLTKNYSFQRVQLPADMPSFVGGLVFMFTREEILLLSESDVIEYCIWWFYGRFYGPDSHDKFSELTDIHIIYFTESKTITMK